MKKNTAAELKKFPMQLPDIHNFHLQGKKILLRTDYDVPLTEQESGGAGEQEWRVKDDTRIRDSLSTINYLLSQQVKIIILAHLGRPDGRVVPGLSLKPVAEKLQELLPQVNFQFEICNFQANQKQVVLLENLRFDPGEEANNLEFTQKLAALGDFYVNNAFAVSHREHASIVGLPKLLPHAAGFDLQEEVQTLSGIMTKPRRPVVVVLGGTKEDKLEAVVGLLSWVDQILIGGKLMTSPAAKNLDQRCQIAALTKEGTDVTMESAQKFVTAVKEAGTIIWSGPLGKAEDPQSIQGTKIFAEAMVNSSAFKVIGGGDTEAILTNLGLVDKVDYISSGGGAMLEFLAKGDLPGLKALRN